MRVLLSVLLAATLLAGSVPAARADSWMPYGRHRFADPTGRRYVVVEVAKGGVAFTLVDARPGSPPAAAGASEGFGAPGPESGVREGDTVVATGTLPAAPLEVRVSSLGLGFAAMEEYGSVGSGASFAWVDRTGVVRHVLRMADLFTAKEIETFTHTTSSVWWFQAAWLDETAREAVVVGNGGLVRVVSLATGKVRRGGDEEVRRAISSPDPEAALPALDLAIARRTAGLEEPLRAVLADARAPLGARLRAAVALAGGGDRRGADLVRATAAAPAEKGATDDRDFALAHLPTLLGKEAVPVLRQAMSAPGAPSTWWAGVLGFVALGEEAVPTLSAMLTEPGKGNDYRGGAAHALARIGSKAALPALVAAVLDREEYVANAALNAAVGIGKGSVSRELAAHLDAKTTQDGRIASYFEENLEPASVGPLVRALERHPKDGYPRSSILAALRFQTGQSLGPDPAAWRAWLARRGG
jgi:hypothetical protein